MENSTVQDQYRAKKRFWQTHMRAWKKSGLLTDKDFNLFSKETREIINGIISI